MLYTHIKPPALSTEEEWGQCHPNHNKHTSTQIVAPKYQFPLKGGKMADPRAEASTSQIWKILCAQK